MNKRHCVNCGELYDLTRKDRQFCSKSCNHRYYCHKKLKDNGRLIKIDHTCKHCSTSFLSYIHNQKFCSDECRMLFNHKPCVEKIEKVCIDCKECFTSVNKRYKRCEKCAEIEYNHIKRKCETDTCVCGNIKRSTNRVCSYCRNKIRYEKNNSQTKTSLIGQPVCESCHKEYPLAVLHFHHIDPEQKSFGMSMRMMKGRSYEEISEEREKTMILCSNCHADIHDAMDEAIQIKPASRHKKDLREKRKQILIDLKNRKCVGCGLVSEKSHIFSFDHVTGEKKFDLSKSNLGRYKWSIILEEAEKCELLCLNCHFYKNSLSLENRRRPIRKLFEERLLIK